MLHPGITVSIECSDYFRYQSIFEFINVKFIIQLTSSALGMYSAEFSLDKRTEFPPLRTFIPLEEEHLSTPGWVILEENVFFAGIH
jgi:hypothetical protein